MDTVKTLTITDRLMALTVLPKVGNIISLGVKQKIAADIAFTQEEITGLSLEQLPDGRATWNRTVQEDYQITVDFGDVGCDLMVKALKDLEFREKLPEDALSLWKLFVDPSLELPLASADKEPVSNEDAEIQ